jgi:nucleotide-binding universal stress UspA family protein
MAKGYKKILIIYRNSSEFLRESFQLAKKEGTWVVVLKPVPNYEGELHLTGIKNLDEILQGYKIKEYKEIKDIAEKEKVLVKIRIEEIEKEEEILDIAIEENCDLIVIEPKKPSLFERFLSLKDRLVELLVTQSPCPVFIIRS